MEKDYLRISSIVLVSLLFGFALVLVNSWFSQPTTEEVVPRLTYLMVMIALFFIDIVAFIFMQLYFIHDRRQFSNRILSLAFLSCLTYFIKTVIIIQQIIERRLTSSVVQNDVAIYHLFRQMSLCILIFLVLVNKVSENTKQRDLSSEKMTLYISLFFVVRGPIVAHILSSCYESYNLHIAGLTNENDQVVRKTLYATIVVFMQLTLLSVNLYFNGLHCDAWNRMAVIAFCAVLYNVSLLFMSRYSVSIWYISRIIEVVSKLTVMVIFMCHMLSTLRVIKDTAYRGFLTNTFNRNYFFNELTAQSALAKKTLYCVMIMDIDHFKRVSDTWGRPVSDQVVKTVVSITRKSIWPDDLLACVDGEEFGVLLTDIDAECVKALAGRIRENVECLTGGDPEYVIPQKAAVSTDTVVTQKNGLNPKEICQLADNALHETKEAGRDRVIVKEAEILINRRDDE